MKRMKHTHSPTHPQFKCHYMRGIGTPCDYFTDNSGFFKMHEMNVSCALSLLIMSQIANLPCLVL
jgi:hypothetical protein